MTLSIAGSIATESLAAISGQIDVVSRNVSGANTQGYSAKTALLVTGYDGGAELKGISRATNPQLLRSLLQAIAGNASSTTISDGLAQIESQMNIAAGSATDLANSSSPAALISGLQTSLQQFAATPSSSTAAEAAVASAKQLAAGLNNTTATTQQVRKDADAQISTSVSNINAILSKFQQVNSAIISGTAAGADVTDQLDQRDNLLGKLAAEIGISTSLRPNNDMVIYTDSGVTLFETTPRTVSFQQNSSLTAGTTGNPVTIDGVAVTKATGTLNIHSGKLVGLTQLRDVAAPRFQSQLDEIARGLVAAFSETDQINSSGATAPGLFTYPGAASPIGTNIISGLAGNISINPSVDPSQGGDVMRLRDGGVSNPGNPNFVYNSTGSSNYSTRILGLISALSAPQTFDVKAGVGASASITSYATSSIGWLAAQRQTTDNAATYQRTMLSQSAAALSNATGINLDDQMSKMLALENSYQASTKLLAAINSLYATLFNAIKA